MPDLRASLMRPKHGWRSSNQRCERALLCGCMSTAVSVRVHCCLCEGALWVPGYYL